MITEISITELAKLEQPKQLSHEQTNPTHLFSADFKAKVALETFKEAYTPYETASTYQVSPVMIFRWKGELLSGVATVFQTKSGKVASQQVVVKTLWYRLDG